jgi:tRNA-uridine 2-sulfurtransferase
MRNWDSRDETGVCSGLQDFEAVQRACDHLGILCQEVDFIKEYWHSVFSTFIEQYQAGFTPNPDILCNEYIKFGAFLDYASKQNTSLVATGHYAQLRTDAHGNVHLAQAVDQNKDQTYFLYGLPHAALQRLLFPVGSLLKAEVKVIARKIGKK